MEFKHAKIENGLNVIAEINLNAATMAAGFFVRTGSRDETSDSAGVSHFLEHMMFKGTDRRSTFDVNRDFDSMGANYNAFTTEENTVYYVAVLPEFQEQVLDLLCDILRPALRREDFDLEKNVIIDEIERYQDMPRFRVYEKLMAEHFENHPLGNGILGTKESIIALKLEQMQAYFDRRYSPHNVTVVAAGKIDFDQFVDKVSQMCSSWVPFETNRSTPPARKRTGRKIIFDEKINREHIGLMSPAPSSQDENRYAAQMLASVVGDATGSRLFYALVDKAIADEASMAYDPLDGEGAFLTFVSADAQRAGDAVRIVAEEFRKFMDEGPTDVEMLAAKNKIASNATLKGELPMGRLTAVGFDWIYRNEYLPLTQQIEKLFATTREEVLSVAQQYDLAATTLVALGPLERL